MEGDWRGGEAVEPGLRITDPMRRLEARQEEEHVKLVGGGQLCAETFRLGRISGWG